MGLLAQRLGIPTPSLYQHVIDLADLGHRIATQAMSELGEAVRDALQGRSGRDAPVHRPRPAGRRSAHGHCGLSARTGRT
jgi:AcrR family transcriptional regulator